LLVESRSLREAARAFVEVSFERVFSHDDPEVALGLGEKPVRIHELEAVAPFQRVPLVDVAVHEDGGVVAMRQPARRCPRPRTRAGAVRRARSTCRCRTCR
jgi:hypothetical protein